MKNFHIQWHITEICNFNCLHCYKEPQRKELNFEELKVIADRLEKFINVNKYTLTVSLTGGEPFLKPEVYDLAEYIEKFSSLKKINFITNGSIIPNVRLKKLSKLGILYVSLENMNKELNDKIRGRGSFEIVFNNLNKLCKEFNVGIMTTLMNINIDDLTKNLYSFVQHLFSIGIKEIIFERFVSVGKASGLKNEVLSKQKILEFYFKLAETFNIDFEELKKYPAVKIVNKEKIFNPENLEIYGAECIFGKDGFAILSDGSVYPCRRFSYEIGNFLTSENFCFNIDKLNLLKKNFLPNDNEIFYCYATSRIMVN